mmetsp:Transcript_67162/g.200627  ORF Transcript_67162/g.200627 Transcript_67162/m.200627 type:complete len:290 (+) Transcript_67162:242-1111(+)
MSHAEHSRYVRPALAAEAETCSVNVSLAASYVTLTRPIGVARSIDRVSPTCPRRSLVCVQVSSECHARSLARDSRLRSMAARLRSFCEAVARCLTSLRSLANRSIAARASFLACAALTLASAATVSSSERLILTVSFHTAAAASAVSAREANSRAAATASLSSSATERFAGSSSCRALPPSLAAALSAFLGASFASAFASAVASAVASLSVVEAPSTLASRVVAAPRGSRITPSASKPSTDGEQYHHAVRPNSKATRCFSNLSFSRTTATLLLVAIVVPPLALVIDAAS